MASATRRSSAMGDRRYGPDPEAGCASVFAEAVEIARLTEILIAEERDQGAGGKKDSFIFDDQSRNVIGKPEGTFGESEYVTENKGG